MQLLRPVTPNTSRTVRPQLRSKYKPRSSLRCTPCSAQHDEPSVSGDRLSGENAWGPQQHAWISRALAAAVSFSLLFQDAASAEEMSIAIPASADAEIRRAQQTMVESWAYVQAYYLEPTFSHTDWTKALQDSLAASFKVNTADEVNDLTNQLLAKLGDPYTRLLQGDKAAALAAQEEGKIVATGLGLQQVLLVPQGTAAAAASPATAAAATASKVTSAATTTDVVAADDSTAAAALNVVSAGKATGAVATPSSLAPAAAAAGSSTADAGEEALVVSFVVEGSPAAAAGVAEGDVLLAVGGQPVAGQELRQVYNLLSEESDVTLLRQPTETSSSSSDTSSNSSSNSSSSIMQGVLPTLNLSAATVADSSSGGNGAGGGGSSSATLLAAAAAGYSPAGAYTVHLKPVPLEFEPVQFGTIDISKAVAAAAAGSMEASSNTNSGSGGSGSSAVMQNVAYLKVLRFSATAPQEVAQALVDVQYEAEAEHGGKGLAGMIVDLRDNPELLDAKEAICSAVQGGIVEAGVSIAQDFLAEGQVLCIAVDRSGQEERVVLPAAHTLTKLPLVVLVNKATASTSELLAGAFHDELSAPLIGTTTYGKGRSQRVVQLADGSSTLLVSTLKYFTPKHAEIDQVGLKPDVACDPPEVVGQRWTGGRVGQGDESFSLLDDPCIKLAAEKLTGTAL